MFVLEVTPKTVSAKQDKHLIFFLTEYSSHTLIRQYKKLYGKEKFYCAQIYILHIKIK